MSVGRKQGALPSQLIEELIESGYITGARSSNVRPASLDLSLSEEIYQAAGIFQPRPGESVRQVLKLISKSKHSYEQPLKRGQMYVARLNEAVALPQSVYGFCNPKSTSGRLDLHVRLLADGVARYDSLPVGWRGELWVSIIPKTFHIQVAPGLALNQIRLFNSDTRFDDTELEVAMQRDKLLWSQKQNRSLEFAELSIKDNDGSLILRLDGRHSAVGYRSRPVNSTIDLTKVNYYNPKQFFEPVYKQSRNILLKKDRFYILSTKEAVRVPPELACEMMPMDERSGEFRSHYAGFIDPGWGWGRAGEGEGRPLTLEVRPFEDLVARDGQPIAKVRFERITERPKLSYDTLDSNYTKQKRAQLAKQFQKWPSK